MKRIVALAVVVLASCGNDGPRSACDGSVDDAVAMFVDVADDAAAWDELGADMFDQCPVRGELVTERLEALAATAD